MNKEALNIIRERLNQIADQIAFATTPDQGKYSAEQDACCANPYPGCDPDPEPCCGGTQGCRPPVETVFSKLVNINNNLAALADTVARLGLWVAVDNVVISRDAPPVGSLSDSLDFVGQRVLVIADLVDSIIGKLGASI